MGCGLAAIMFGQSMMHTVQQQLIEKATGSITGHIQIQNRRTSRSRSSRTNTSTIPLPSRKPWPPSPASRPSASASTSRAWSPRRRAPGHADLRRRARKEPRRHDDGQYITAGRFLSKTGKDIVMGDKLAQQLDVRLGEKVVVMAQAQRRQHGRRRLPRRAASSIPAARPSTARSSTFRCKATAGDARGRPARSTSSSSA